DAGATAGAEPLTESHLMTVGSDDRLICTRLKEERARRTRLGELRESRSPAPHEEEHVVEARPVRRRQHSRRRSGCRPQAGGGGGRRVRAGDGTTEGQQEWER